MKKIISLFLALLLFTSLFAVDAKGLSADALSAQCAALMCVQTGELLFEKNAHTRRSMASTTKIMTAILALEQLTPQKQVKVTSKMLNGEGTSLGLAENDV
ncbi:MAG: D-alanyl-D-alanine carboxypeptidase, partial [Clostridia bacterium]|nr:D-alanyl-D-alanine carboxypeptidase [Clostridia bacterium]